jgi:hypothetical protein
MILVGVPSVNIQIVALFFVALVLNVNAFILMFLAKKDRALIGILLLISLIHGAIFASAGRDYGEDWPSILDFGIFFIAQSMITIPISIYSIGWYRSMRESHSR